MTSNTGARTLVDVVRPQPAGPATRWAVNRATLSAPTNKATATASSAWPPTARDRRPPPALPAPADLRPTPVPARQTGLQHLGQEGPGPVLLGMGEHVAGPAPFDDQRRRP